MIARDNDQTKRQMHPPGEPGLPYWQRVDVIFNIVLDTPADQRGSRLDTLCGGDAVLRAGVTRLLESDGRAASGFLEPPAAFRPSTFAGERGSIPQDQAALQAAQRWVGRRIAGYVLVRAIGVGGMGAVYEATQDRPRRTVALKLMQGALASPQRLRRFVTEAEILADLHHPNIAQVYAAGTGHEDPDGAPYIALELIPDAAPITRFVQERRLECRASLELFLEVCDALQYVHQRGVIHRDLKPANILVDAAGRPRVIDFGVARLVEGDPAATRLTDARQLVGTLAYMSPEQVRGDTAQVDTRSDVYALGVVLFELLTGRLPYEIVAGNLPAAIRAIESADPPRLGSMDRSLRGDLETIVQKALEKRPERRYPSVEGLADDLRRFLRHEPIQARGAGAVYQLGKFVRRNRALSAGVGIALVGLLVGGATAGGLAVSARKARDRAEQAAQAAEIARQAEVEQRRQADDQRKMAEASAAKARRVTEYIQNMLGSADAYSATKGPDYTVREMLDEVARNLGEQLKGEPEVEIAVRVTIGRAYLSLARYDDASTHLETALVLAQQTSSDEAIAVALDALAWTANARNDFDAAEEMFHRALEIRRRRLGPHSEAVAWCLGNLSEVTRRLGRLDEAEEFAREALSISKLFGDEHTHTAWALTVLARALQAKGHDAAAEPLYRDALAMRRRLKGDDCLDAAWDLRDLGLLLSKKGDHAAAEPLFRQSLAVRRRLLGDEHPHTNLALNDLALVLFNKGDGAEAGALLREQLARSRGLFGDDHPNAAEVVYALATALHSTGYVGEAEALLRQELARFRELLGEGHPLTLEHLRNLSKVYYSEGDFAQAEALLRQGLATAREELGNEHDMVHRLLGMLGETLLKLKKYDDAEAVLRECLNLRQQAFPNGHSNVWSRYCAVQMLGGALAGQAAELAETDAQAASDLFAEAESMLLDGYHGMKDDPRVPDPSRNLGFDNISESLERIVQLYEAWDAAEPGKGYDAKAEALLHKVLAQSRSVLGDGHPQTLEHLLDLSKLLYAEGAFAEAEALVREGLESAREGMGVRNELVGRLLGMLGETLLKLEKHDDAEPLLRECLAIRERLFPDGHRDVWWRYCAVQMLGGALAGQAADLAETDAQAAAELFAEAERMLLHGYHGMKDDPHVPHPSRDLFDNLGESLARLVQLYEAWDVAEPGQGYAEEASEWRATLERQSNVARPPTGSD
jgi:tetratricopeptide (TPR) repeat protein